MNNTLFDSKLGDVTQINMPIGQTTPAAGAFTTVAATSIALTGGIGSAIPQQAYVAIATGISSNNLTLSGPEVTGGSVLKIIDFTETLSADASLTLPSVATVVTAMKAAGLVPVAGMTWVLRVMNDQSGSYNLTLTADSGPTWTLSGTAQTVAKTTYRDWLVTLTSLTAGTMQSLGEVTFTAAP